MQQSEHPSTYMEPPAESVLERYIRETSFKRIFNQVISAQARLGFKSIGVLSQYEGEGKSFFVSALALAYTRFLRSRVLIVETVHQTRDHALSLSHLIAPYTSSGVLAGSNQGCIDLVSTESLRTGEFDTSDFQLGGYIRQVGSDYDVVIIDTCSLDTDEPTTVDPLIVGRAADQNILITSSRSHTTEHLRAALRLLEKYGLRLLGSIYNGGGGL